MTQLPIDAYRGDIEAALKKGPVVISAPTGSGKSTQVPRWVPSPVLVVEPRRVACRSLAARVASLEGTDLGNEVGYHVRDEPKHGKSTRILFVTPGIALREFDRLDRFQTVILDEFHERTLDVDLLFALLRRRTKPWVVMSATLEADRIADAVGGQHVKAEGRTHPVDIRYSEGGPAFPTSQHLVDRVTRAVEALKTPPGDVLVFLPGKAEIGAVGRKLGGKAPYAVMPLHGGMPLSEQARVFAPATKPKVVLTTNVAETSVTVPGVRVVIDSGLVRQTRYHQGMGALALVPIAKDSAEQRAGRAGRTAPGVCQRLWKPHAHLKDRTLPEVHRESLVPLVLAALACGRDPDELAFLDAPKEHALASAKEELQHLGAIDDQGTLTERGRALFHLPLDPSLGRFLIEAQAQAALDDAIDLVAMLAVGRPVFSDSGSMLDDDDPRAGGCDLVAAVSALRRGKQASSDISSAALAEAREHRRRLRKAMQVSHQDAGSKTVDREQLIRVAVAADRRKVYVARRRGRHVAWANGGTEIELDRRSALELVTRDGHTKLPEAMVVLGVRAMSDGPSVRIIATSASPVSKAMMRELGLGRDRPAETRYKKGRITVDVERVYAGKILDTREVEPQGELLRTVVRDLVLEGRMFKTVREVLHDRLTSATLIRQLVRTGLWTLYEEEVAPLEGISADAKAFLLQRLETLGVESVDDLDLLESEDLLPDALPEYLLKRLDGEYPRKVNVGDAVYEVNYDLPKRQANLLLVRGQRRTPPQRQYLPRFPGLILNVQAGGTFHRLK